MFPRDSIKNRRGGGSDILHHPILKSIRIILIRARNVPHRGRISSSVRNRASVYFRNVFFFVCSAAYLVVTECRVSYFVKAIYRRIVRMCVGQTFDKRFYWIFLVCFARLQRAIQLFRSMVADDGFMIRAIR